MPDEKTRRRIFQIHTKKMTLAEDLDLEEYITAKDDLSGADIKVRVSKEFLHPVIEAESASSSPNNLIGPLLICNFD